jgi:hypothetical protein
VLDRGAVVDLAAGHGHAYAAATIDGVAHVFALAAPKHEPVDLGAAPGLVPGTLDARADGVAWASADAGAILMFPAPGRM